MRFLGRGGKLHLNLNAFKAILNITSFNDYLTSEKMASPHHPERHVTIPKDTTPNHIETHYPT